MISSLIDWIFDELYELKLFIEDAAERSIESLKDVLRDIQGRIKKND